MPAKAELKPRHGRVEAVLRLWRVPLSSDSAVTSLRATQHIFTLSISVELRSLEAALYMNGKSHRTRSAGDIYLHGNPHCLRTAVSALFEGTSVGGGNQPPTRRVQGLEHEEGRLWWGEGWRGRGRQGLSYGDGVGDISWDVGMSVGVALASGTALRWLPSPRSKRSRRTSHTRHQHQYSTHIDTHRASQSSL